VKIEKEIYGSVRLIRRPPAFWEKKNHQLNHFLTKAKLEDNPVAASRLPNMATQLNMTPSNRSQKMQSPIWVSRDTYRSHNLEPQASKSLDTKVTSAWAAATYQTGCLFLSQRGSFLVACCF
jgi:hypothetical protein